MDSDVQRQIKLLQQRMGRVEIKPGGLYAEGTWTPAFAGTTIAGTFTYTAQQGYYIRIGNAFHIHCNLSISAIGVAPTGNLTITGLPFTATAALNCAFDIGFLSQFTYSVNAKEIMAVTSPSTTTILLFESFSAAGGNNLPAGNLGATGRIILAGTYR